MECNISAKNIFLVGQMGSGKSTVGRALAKKLNKPFFDSDREIEARANASIPLIFKMEGEKGFRQRETEVIRDLSRRCGIVLATGGGVVVRSENCEYLKSRGNTIHLQSSTRNVLQRIGQDENRPLLKTMYPLERLEALLKQRNAQYLYLAKIKIDTDSYNIQLLIQRILDQIQ